MTEQEEIIKILDKLRKDIIECLDRWGLPNKGE